jgi:small redox-active disulfide protein 2
MMKVSVLGTGCAKCDKLYATVRQALDELGLDAELEKVSGIQEIMAFGVMMTPALAVDGEVKAAGKVPSLEDIKEMLS